jgi:putative transposase
LLTSAAHARQKGKTMARRDVEFVQGEYYHIYNRGANRMSIFRDVKDYADVLGAMNEYGKKLKISIIAYCLMVNHFHWLVRQDGEAPAGLLSQRVYNGYSKRFNARYNHSGTIFASRFKAIHVDKDEYLDHLCCYIHANPVKDRFALTPELWPYSNYHEWLGLRNGNLVDHQFIAENFPDREQYRKRVQDYLTGRTQLPPAFRTYLENLWRDEE